MDLGRDLGREDFKVWKGFAEGGFGNNLGTEFGDLERIWELILKIWKENIGRIWTDLGTDFQDLKWIGGFGNVFGQNLHRI